MDHSSEKQAVEVVFPENASFEQVCTVADKMNRKLEEGILVYKVEMNSTRHIVDIVRIIQGVIQQNSNVTFLVLRNKFLESSLQLQKALKMIGVEFYNEDDESVVEASQFMAQDFLVFNECNCNGIWYREAIIRVNYDCNERCKFCWIRDDETAVSPEKIKKVIADLIEKENIRHFVFTGGEPTLLKELPELIAYSKDKGATQIVLQTNGVLLADKKRVERLVECGLDQVFLALHSDIEQVSETITGLKGSFKKTVQALENFMQTDVEVVIDYVLSKENIKHVESFAEFVIELYYKHRHEVKINFAVAQPMGKYASVFIQHTPTITEIREHLVSAMSKLSVSPVMFNGFSMACGPPLCAVNGNPLFLGDIAEVNPEESARDFIKTSRCEDCKLTNYCWGIRKIYAKHFGTDEIEPIK